MLPPTHPDGDPFAEKDAALAALTPLGRMEARALEEQRALESNGDSRSSNSSSSTTAPRVPVLPPSRTSSRQSRSSFASPRAALPPPAEKEEVIVLDEDETDAEDQAMGEVTKDIAGEEEENHGGKLIGMEVEEGLPREGEVGQDVEMKDAPLAEDARKGNDDAGTSTSTLAGRDNLPQPAPSTSEPLPSTSTADVAAKPTSPPSLHVDPAAGVEEGEGKRLEVENLAAVDATAPVVRRKHESPVPAPPKKPPPPPRTIRLSITLPPRGTVTEVPEYSVADMSIAEGFGAEEEDEKEGESGSGSGDGSGSESEGVNKKENKAIEKEAKQGEMEGEGSKMEGIEMETKAEAHGPVVPAKRKRAGNKIQGRHGGYDTEDPFVDDTDLSLYEPQWYHRPKQEGFFVCSGKLELISDSKSRGRVLGSKNKPKYDKDGKLIPARRAPNKGLGAVGPPIASTSGTNSKAASTSALAVKKKIIDTVVISDDDNAGGGRPSVSSVPAFGSGAVAPPAPAVPKKKKKVPGILSPILQNALDKLKAVVDKTDFSLKGKFPPDLRAPLVEVAFLAMELGEYDDDFFNALPKVFPYNCFTLKKLTKREVFPRRIQQLIHQQESSLDVIKAGITDSLESQLADFKKLKDAWVEETENRQKAADERRRRLEEEILRQDDPPLGTPEPNAQLPVNQIIIAALPNHSDTVVGGSSQPNSPMPAAGLGNDGEEVEAPEPKFKFRLTDAMKIALYQIYTIEDQMSELITEKQTLEKVTEKGEKGHSAANARKQLYQKVAALWPNEVMTTNQLSREMSQMKKKMEKEKEREEKEREA